jgi:hypothetical protein
MIDNKMLVFLQSRAHSNARSGCSLVAGFKTANQYMIFAKCE